MGLSLTPRSMTLWTVALKIKEVDLIFWVSGKKGQESAFEKREHWKQDLSF